MAKKLVSKPKTGTAKKIEYDSDKGTTTFTHKDKTTKSGGKKKIKYEYKDDE